MKTFTIKDDGKLKTSEIMNLVRTKFKVWSYYDDARLDKDFPKPKQPTERVFRDCQEPDEEYRGLSVRQFEEKYPDKKGITLRERMLLEIAYFDKYGEHLDIKGVTFCSGSRGSDGDVPDVHWSSDAQEVRVPWYSLYYSGALYGVREAISLDPFSSNPSEQKIEQEAIDLLKSKGFKIIKEY